MTLRAAAILVLLSVAFQVPAVRDAVVFVKDVIGFALALAIVIGTVVLMYHSILIPLRGYGWVRRGKPRARRRSI